LPVSNFDLALDGYEAYDTDRVPFNVDVIAFFRIKDTAKAAQRVKDINELKSQLLAIVQGSVRKVLASDFIDSIMLERARFGDAFSEEVVTQLDEWGVEPVKAMELMDIRDGEGSEVIANIMKKKTSDIEQESRTEVAINKKKAETAEIESQEAIDVRQQEADEAVGKRTAEKEKAVGIAKQKSEQDILEQQKETREREMEVQRVQLVRLAEITKKEQIVAASQDQETRVIIADGKLQEQQKEAQGIEAVGKAQAEAEKAMQMASVEAQLALAEEIGSNKEYQLYLQALKAIEAYATVGSKQAEALKEADLKVIANAGTPTEGANKLMDLFTTGGGTQLAGMIEGFAQSSFGKLILQKAGIASKDVEDLATGMRNTNPDS
jgi:flotillin